MSAKSKRRRSARPLLTMLGVVLGVVLLMVISAVGSAVYVESATACPITVPGGDR